MPSSDKPGIRVGRYRLYEPAFEFVLVAMQMPRVFVVRLTILILAMPVFALFVVSVHPFWITFPFALVVAITASTFKKHL